MTPAPCACAYIDRRDFFSYFPPCSSAPGPPGNADARRESAHRESAHRESAHRESAHRESAHRESARRESAHR
ncbi:hypothetical protein LJC15_03565, partial [Desulfovibrio sp. OttesenSCG-928-G11]|nr:hypothetical protein [Desulfovibrio sp. OttesenSCG-928-G11]